MENLLLMMIKLFLKTLQEGLTLDNLQSFRSNSRSRDLQLQFQERQTTKGISLSKTSHMQKSLLSLICRLKFSQSLRFQCGHRRFFKQKQQISLLLSYLDSISEENWETEMSAKKQCFCYPPFCEVSTHPKHGALCPLKSVD